MLIVISYVNPDCKIVKKRLKSYAETFLIMIKAIKSFNKN